MNHQFARSSASPLITQSRFVAGWIAALLGLSLILSCASTVQEYADKIAPLIDPAKLATLKARGANPRVQKVTYWLWAARGQGLDMAKVTDLALTRVRMTNAGTAELTKAAMLRNVTVAERFGCFDAEGQSEMRKGNAATVRLGPYAGDQLSVDHIIPRAVAPELDNVMANLELMPLRMNMRKNASIGQRQKDLAQKLFRAGLLSSHSLLALR